MLETDAKTGRCSTHIDDKGVVVTQPDRSASQITEIVLTGGPCSGKTTSLSYLQQKLSDYGFRVLICPEVPTFVILGGVQDIGDLAANRRELFFDVERHILGMQRGLRTQYLALAEEFARQGERVVILYDRGESDIASYMTPEEFEAILEEKRLSWFDVRDSYDAVLHLVTIAKDKPEYYTTDNNEARRESVEEAVALDERTLAAWIGTPHLKIIDNNGATFEDKIRKAFQAATRAIGIPVPLEIERKFLLAAAPDFSMPELAHAQAFEIEQTYLVTTDPDAEVRVRKRTGKGGSVSYYRTEKIKRTATTREEREAIITPREYLKLLESKDTSREPIVKTRYTFVYDNQHFELDVFHGRLAGIVTLEVELTEEQEQLSLPPFLQIVREVTDEGSYSNSRLASLSDDEIAQLVAG